MEHATFVSVDRRDEPQSGSLVGYDDDPHAWAMQQAELLKARRFAELDLVNLADEIADVGRREYDALVSDLSRVVQHLLKWDHRPSRRSRGWASTIKEHRRRVVKRLDDNPSLKRRRDEAFREASKRGRAEALIETDLPDDAFPVPYNSSWDEAMTRPVLWPEP